MQPITSSQSSSTNTQKQIPFKQIRPIKFMGMSSSLPFNSLISDSKLIYFSGRSIILQNIKTYQQKPIWTNEFQEQPQVIQHVINIHRENIVGIAIRDNAQNHLIIIININSQINNYQHLNKKEREKDRLHYLKTLPGEQTTIERLKFLHQASLFAVLVSQNDHRIANPKTILIHSSMTGELLHDCSFPSQFPLIESLQLNRQNYICIMKNQPEQPTHHPKRAFNHFNHLNNLKKLSSDSQNSNIKEFVSLFTVTLINSSQLNNKNDFLIELNTGQFVIELKFFQNHKKTFAFLLLNSGFLVIYMINQRGFHDALRVDVRIDKEEYDIRIKYDKKTTFSTQKTEQNDKDKTSFRKLPRQQAFDSVDRFIENAKSRTSKQSNQVNFQDEVKEKDQTLKVPESKNRVSTLKSSSSAPFECFMPTCICCTSCKVVIGYQGCNFIGLMTYSAVNHRDYKFKYISDFFLQKPEIESIRKISFSEDGCHCSVLVKVDPHKSKVLRKNKCCIKSEKLTKGQCNKFVDDFMDNDDLRYPNYYETIESQNKSIKGPGTMTPKLTSKQIARIQKRAKILNPKSSSQFTQLLELKSLEQEDQEREHFALMHIDFISGMIEHEYHSESIEQSLTSTALNGIVEFVEFNDMNNTMLVLMSDSRLYYYYLNPSNVHSDKEMLNCARGNNINLVRKKLQASGMFGQKAVSNFLSPQSIPLWVDKLKIKPCLMLCHPFMFELVLVFPNNLKFHFFNYNKLFESHHVLNIKNCKSATYSPFGDKLVLGTAGCIWLVDSYTHSVIKKISLVIFPTQMKTFSNKSSSKISDDKSQSRNTGRRSDSVFISLSSKTVSRIQYINNDDIMIQTGNTTISMLLNYDKVVYYGSTSEAIQGQLLCYDLKHRLGVIASDTSVKVITKCSINSKNKCEELAKFDLSITAIKLCGEIDILFLGGANGILYFIRWPEFFQTDTVKTHNINNKLHLFHCPIVDIQISINYRQLFVMSKDGMMVICDLMHSDQIDKIGKDVSYVMSKKIDLPLPLANKWLVSASDQEKRAQNITKLMGNEAEFKNNEALLSQEYRTKLEKLSQMQKQDLQEQLKNQIRQYEEESGISKLLQRIVSVKDEIKRMIGKKQTDTKRINQQIDEDLHRVFVERQKLQKQLKQLTAQTTHQKSQLLQDNHKEFSGYQQLAELQLKQDENSRIQTEKMFERKTKVDRVVQENMVEDFMDEKYEVQKIYAQQLEDVYLKNNELNTMNRNKNVEITLITQKMRELAARMEELQNDCNDLEKQNKQVTASKKTLCQQISQTDKKYHALIKKTKEMEITLNKTRTSSEACQLKFDELEKQMELLQQRWVYLEMERQKSEHEFSEQFKLKNSNFSQTQEVKHKIEQLKAKRKQFFETNVLLKSLMKPYEKEFNAMNMSQTTDPDFIACIDSSMIELKKFKTNKLTSDVDKWNTVKNDNKRKFIKYNEKLQEENNKLVYRFNELQKDFKDLVKIETHLKAQIASLKQKDSMNYTKWEKFSFVQKDEIKEEGEEKVSTTSIHRPFASFASTENLRQTSYNSSTTKSLHRDFASNDNLKKAGVRLNSMFRDSEALSKINKKGSKNLQSLIQEKRQLFKQKRDNGQSLYHGVTLDKDTLKPKKTMCLSLHQEGSQTGKFVTQY